MSKASDELLRISRFKISRNMLYIDLWVAPGFHHTRLIPGLADRLLAAVPELRDQRCFNDFGRSLPEELPDTETGHAIEHVILGLLSRVGVYGKGLTWWKLREPEKNFYIEISVEGKIPETEAILAVSRAISLSRSMLAEHAVVSIWASPALLSGQEPSTQSYALGGAQDPRQDSLLDS